MSPTDQKPEGKVDAITGESTQHQYKKSRIRLICGLKLSFPGQGLSAD